MSARAFAAAVMQPDTPRVKFAAFAVSSESMDTTYTIYLYTDGSLSCNGPDWIFQTKDRIAKLGMFRGQKRCEKHTMQFEPYVDDLLCGKLPVERFGGVLVNPDGKPKNPKTKATPFILPDVDAGSVESNLRRRFVRG
jgi:hypothetical protein